MGKTAGALLQGLGAGLSTIGQGLMQKKQDEKEQARYESQQEYKERELDIREKDAENRAKAAERQELMDTTKIKHSNLVRDLSLAGDNQELRAQAYSQYHPDRRQYKPNQAARAKLEEVEGKPVFAVWDVSYNDTNPATGEIIIDETSGRAKQIQSPAGPMIFRTSDEFANWQAKIMNPDLFLAYEAQGLSDQMALDRARKLHEQRAATPLGEAELKVKQATADHKKAQAKKLEKETELLGSDTGQMSATERKGLNQLASSMRSAYPGYAIDEKVAKKMAMMVSDDKTRGRVAKSLRDAFDSDNPEGQLEAFIQAGVDQGIPREYMEKIRNDAQIGFEAREKHKPGSDGWIKEMLSGVAAFFQE